jgi:hypothetical protein
MLAKFVVGLTITVTLTIGPYVLSLAHTIGGETRVSHSLALDRVQKGQSVCLTQCAPGFKTESFETVDMSAPDLIALNASRSGGEITADVGLYKNVSIPTGKFKLRLGLSAAVTKTLHDKDAIHFLQLPIVKPFVPQRAQRLITDYELRHKIWPPTFARKPPFVSDAAWKSIIDGTTYEPALTSTPSSSKPGQVIAAKSTQLSQAHLNPDVQRLIADFNRQFATSRLNRPAKTLR